MWHGGGHETGTVWPPPPPLCVPASAELATILSIQHQEKESKFQLVGFGDGMKNTKTRYLQRDVIHILVVKLFFRSLKFFLTPPPPKKVTQLKGNPCFKGDSRVKSSVRFEVQTRFGWWSKEDFSSFTVPPLQKTSCTLTFVLQTCCKCSIRFFLNSPCSD